MPRDPEAFAEMVILTVKAALAPIMERLALAEQRNAELQTRVQDLSGLRDRLTVVETKSAVVAAASSEPPPVVDLAPVMERLSVAEQSNRDLHQRVHELKEIRDRLVTVETKAAEPRHEPPVAVDLAPVLERVAVAEATLATLGDVRDRMVAVETKVANPVSLPVPPETRGVWLTATEMELAVTKAIAPVSERLAVLETKAPVPGPAGKDGANGQPGQDGASGQDGLGFDDVSVDFDGDRTLSVKFVRGDRVKAFPISLPYLRYQGVYQEGKSYEEGDVATWGGSTWHCKSATTTKPGDGSAAWVLVVKRGRDGRDGRDGHDTVLPVVKVAV